MLPELEEPARLSVGLIANRVDASQLTVSCTVLSASLVALSGFRSLAEILPKSTTPFPDRPGVQALGVIRPLTVRSTLLAAKAVSKKLLKKRPKLKLNTPKMFLARLI